MTITEMVSIMLSAENGAKIEMRRKYTPGMKYSSSRRWFPDDDPSWDWETIEYRVAEFPQEQDDE